MDLAERMRRKMEAKHQKMLGRLAAKQFGTSDTECIEVTVNTPVGKVIYAISESQIKFAPLPDELKIYHRTETGKFVPMNSVIENVLIDSSSERMKSYHLRDATHLYLYHTPTGKIVSDGYDRPINLFQYSKSD